MLLAGCAPCRRRSCVHADAGQIPLRPSGQSDLPLAFASIAVLGHQPHPVLTTLRLWITTSFNSREISEEVRSGSYHRCICNPGNMPDAPESQIRIVIYPYKVDAPFSTSPQVAEASSSSVIQTVSCSHRRSIVRRSI